MNSKEELENFNDHVNLITFDLPHEQTTTARQFWKTLVSTFAKQLPLPIIEHFEEFEVGTLVRFSWNSNVLIAVVEIWPDGMCHWFILRTEGVIGSKQEREVIPTTQIIELIRQYFMQTVQVV